MKWYQLMIHPQQLRGGGGLKAYPYVVKSKTRVVNESLNPVWNQNFDFVVEDGLHEMLMRKVWDHDDTFGKDFM